MAAASSPARAGVMGWPVGHSLSPRLHGYWLERYGIEGRYEALAVPPDDLENALMNIVAGGYAGANLTIPHKEKALALVDEADAIARRIGAVNTVIVKNGRLTGTNTDAHGFMSNLHNQQKIDTGNALVLGAGGAARAVCAGLLDSGWNVTLAGRSRAKSETLAEKIGGNIRVTAWEALPTALPEASLLVNTTPLGMRGQAPLSLSLASLPLSARVCDIVYAPEPTPATRRHSDPTFTDLLARAKERGHPVVTGLGMLLYQAQPAFEAWFGVKPEVTDELHAYMLEAL